jgi:surface antigen
MVFGLQGCIVQNRSIMSADSEAARQSKAAQRRITMLVACLGIALSGCSVSMPIGSFFGEDETPPTASVEPATKTIPITGQPSLTPSMDGEDTRRSQSALALALDPEGNGVPVNWDNPQSGAKGSFRSTSDFYLAGNQLCRKFKADFDRSGQASAYEGSACRAGPQNWVITGAVEQGFGENEAEPIGLDASAQR